MAAITVTIATAIIMTVIISLAGKTIFIRELAAD